MRLTREVKDKCKDGFGSKRQRGGGAKEKEYEMERLEADEKKENRRKGEGRECKGGGSGIWERLKVKREDRNQVWRSWVEEKKMAGEMTVNMHDTREGGRKRKGRVVAKGGEGRRKGGRSK